MHLDADTENMQIEEVKNILTIDLWIREVNHMLHSLVNGNM
jgi:hypothetical protein